MSRARIEDASFQPFPIPLVCPSGQANFVTFASFANRISRFNKDAQLRR
jgi:hypothetical protein